MYNAFSDDYDRFVNWQSRLDYELPFIEAQLLGLESQSGGALRILDSACGTGMHALALAQRGFQVAGADLSEGMIARAKQNAATTGDSPLFVSAGFGSLAKAFRGTELFPFDAVLCLGNSLPHVIDSQELAITLDDFADCLRPGGLLLIQNRNFDLVMDQHQRWMEPQAHQEDKREWVFLRFYDFVESSLIDFNILTLRRDGDEPWSLQIHTTRLRPLLHDPLAASLKRAGFSDLRAFGDMTGASFETQKSGNLILTGRKML